MRPATAAPSTSPKYTLPSTPPASPRWGGPSQAGEEGESWWPLIFSDLVLLLFCFFVIWHVADKRRAGVAAQALRPVPLQPPATVSDSAPSLPAAKPRRETVSDPDPLQLIAVPEPASVPSKPVQPLTRTESASHASWADIQAEIRRSVHEQGLDHAVTVAASARELIISLTDTITFPSGQATLNPAATPLLSRVAAIAADYPELFLEISGHTDDRPVATAEFPSNWELSAARASRVARALLEQGGIDPTRISTRGYAHYQPLYANDSEAHRAANRRVEIRFFRSVGTSAKTLSTQSVAEY